MTTRSSLSLLLLLGALACAQAPDPSEVALAASTRGDTVTMSPDLGVVIARDSLATIDQHALSCCSIDSSGVGIAVTGGTLTFYAAASYAETAYTPAGPRAAACVQEVPNGAHIGVENLVTLTSGETYLLFSCTAGYFTVMLNQHLSYGDGSSTTRVVTLSSGRYGWERGLLSLTPPATSGSATATMSGANILVNVGGQSLSFIALPRP